LVKTTVTLSPRPLVRAGLVARTSVELTNCTLVAEMPPNVTVAPSTKSVPVIVTTVPPLDDPPVGALDDNDGAGAAARIGPAYA
jgi:hypothetical protein